MAKRKVRTASRNSRPAKRRAEKRSAAKRKGRTKKKAGRRASFERVWTRLGASVLRVVQAERGCDRKSFALRLESDPEMRRLVVERIVHLLPAKVALLRENPAAPAINEEDRPPSRADELADEYVLAQRCLEHVRDETPQAEESAGWRLF